MTLGFGFVLNAPGYTHERGQQHPMSQQSMRHVGRVQRCEKKKKNARKNDVAERAVCFCIYLCVHAVSVTEKNVLSTKSLCADSIKASLRPPFIAGVENGVVRYLRHIHDVRTPYPPLPLARTHRLTPFFVHRCRPHSFMSSPLVANPGLAAPIARPSPLLR